MENICRPNFRKLASDDAGGAPSTRQISTHVHKTPTLYQHGILPATAPVRKKQCRGARNRLASVLSLNTSNASNIVWIPISKLELKQN